jgi:aryl-alcohol dehydrogenase-like predicted oxidoreductase
MNLVEVPGTGRKTTQLGFGCSYLNTSGAGAIDARRLLDEAYDCGIRHFDTAPRYGQGSCEELLGRFLACHKGETTVTTKYGLLPPTPTKRIIDAVRRRAKFIPGFLFGPMGGKRGSYKVAQATESLAQSLKNLQTEHIDLLLLHEPTPADLKNDDFLRFLEDSQKKGQIGNFGIGGNASEVPKLFSNCRPYCPVLQFEWACHQTHVDIPGSYPIHFRAGIPAAKYFKDRFANNPSEQKKWSDTTGLDLSEGDNLYAVCLKASMAAFPNSLVLFSSRHSDHIRRNVEIAEDISLDKPAVAFLDLIKSIN